MDEDSSPPLGVKMLADHLVSVKLQYEERINDLLVHIKSIEKEKENLIRHYKMMEDELETRRQEIFQMKREASAEYVMEERENWKALLNQQKQENIKLKKDIEIDKARIESLENQLKQYNEKEVEEKSQEDISDMTPNTQPLSDNITQTTLADILPSTELSDQSSENEEEVNASLSQMGPPQPLAPPPSDDSLPSQETLLIQKEALEVELKRVQNSISELKNQLVESKHINQKLTDQFMQRVDLLESEHKERENGLINTIEGLRAKLDIELEKKWELTQQLHAQEQSQAGLFSFLWG